MFYIITDYILYIYYKFSNLRTLLKNLLSLDAKFKDASIIVSQ